MPSKTPAPSLHMPQANNLRTVQRALDALCEQEDWKAAWRAMGVVEYGKRQPSYYADALRQLGFADYRRLDDLHLTEAGHAYKQATPVAREALFQGAVLEHPAVKLALELHAVHGGKGLFEQMAAHPRVVATYSTSVINRRVDTVLSWTRTTLGVPA